MHDGVTVTLSLYLCFSAFCYCCHYRHFTCSFFSVRWKQIIIKISSVRVHIATLNTWKVLIITSSLAFRSDERASEGKEQSTHREEENEENKARTAMLFVRLWSVKYCFAHKINWKCEFLWKTQHQHPCVCSAHIHTYYTYIVIRMLSLLWASETLKMRWHIQQAIHTFFRAFHQFSLLLLFDSALFHLHKPRRVWVEEQEKETHLENYLSTARRHCNIAFS